MKCVLLPRRLSNALPTKIVFSRKDEFPSLSHPPPVTAASIAKPNPRMLWKEDPGRDRVIKRGP